MTNLQTLKEEGNKHFKNGDYNEAKDHYSKALEEAESKEDRLVFLKNRSACHLKLEEYQSAVDDATKALNISNSDVKALFRRVQGLEQLGSLKMAYADARRLNQLDANNKTVQDMCRRLRQVLEVKMFEERSTENKVKRMMEIMFDLSCDAEKRSKACNNLLVLALEEDGAEEIFREAGPSNLSLMLDNATADIRVNVLRVMAALAKGHASRSLVILRGVTIGKMCEIMGTSKPEGEDGGETAHDQISNAVFHLVQSIVNALQGDESKAFRTTATDMAADFSQDLFEVMMTLRDMLIDKEVSADGRDNAIALIAKNIPREDVRRGNNARTLKFVQVGGLKNLLAVASRGYQIESSPYPMTKNTRQNCSVALSKLYDDLLSDQARSKWDEGCQTYVQALFAKGESVANMRAMSIITCLLQGPFDCGNQLIGLKGVLEIMMAMTSTDEEESQVAAVEAIISATSKCNKASFVVQNGTNLLKQLYKKSKSNAVKVRALVGLCKLGSSHGTDVSLRPFADGSTVKLAKHCKKFLSLDSVSFESKKWAAEGLSFLTLDADVKEDLCNDKVACQALFKLCKTKDKTVIYGVASTLVNCTNTYEKKEEVTPEMIAIAKYSKTHIPEEHEMDKPEHAKKRSQLLVEAGMISALVHLANVDTSIQSDKSKELLCRLFRITTETQEYRGQVVAAGGGKVLLPLSTEGTIAGKRLASHSLARIAITSDPRMVFPGQKSLECVRVLKQLLHPECEAIETFEALMALTNLASLDDHHRRRIIREKMICDIETYCLEEHVELRRAATQLMCNMCLSEEFRTMMESPDHERVKMLVLLCAEDDVDTRVAASGSLAILTSSSEIVAKKIRNCCQSWLENITILIVDDNTDISHRGLCIVRDMIEVCKFSAEEFAKCQVFEVMMVRSRDTSPATKKLRMVALEALDMLAKEKFIEPTGL